MKITHGIEQIKFAKLTATTLGSYDGLHLGHRDILQTLINRKTDSGYSRSVVVTFDPHPQEILRKNNTDIQLLTTIEERLELFASAGIDETVIIAFTKEFSETTYRDFFNNILVDKLGTREMIVGHDHAFGKNREGDIAHLKILAAEREVAVTEVPPHRIANETISSTKIRHYLLGGDIQIANSYLGRKYSLTGVVVSGDKLGRTLGFPTANVKIPANKLIPKDGIYAGIASHQTNDYLAAISIGTRPTVTESPNRIIEAALLDFSGDLYDEQIRLSLSDYLRDQIKFASLEELKGQIEQDIELVKELSE
ncbi:MAG TPA: bifunctional riboflavin kinase/FAD synthetase [Candidatus Kapabacteria bacterium]|nr:bifunctional riboflavin kinase/FAD synthetase [Candidatus Kapabacteria bacterium]